MPGNNLAIPVLSVNGSIALAAWHPRSAPRYFADMRIIFIDIFANSTIIPTPLKALSSMNEIPETSQVCVSRPPGLYAAAASGFIAVLIWILGWKLMDRPMGGGAVLGGLNTAWLVFFIGAWLSYALPRWTARHSWWRVLIWGTLASLGIGLLLVAGAGICEWLLVHAYSRLAGIHLNPPYRGALLGQMFWRVAVVVGLWVIGAKICSPRRDSPPVSSESGVWVRLDFIGYLLSAVAGVAATIGLALLLVLADDAATAKGAAFSFEHLPMVFVYLSGLTVLGPLFTVSFFPNAPSSGHFGLAVGLPVLLAALLPILLANSPVRPRKAIFLWCGVTAAFFFWAALGVDAVFPHVG
jgi:hypothetical protein